jgi:hypothetical protein
MSDGVSVHRIKQLLSCQRHIIRTANSDVQIIVLLIG